MRSQERRSTARTIAEWSEATGADVDEAIIVDVLEDLRVQGWLNHSPPGLTSPEIEYLEKHGGVEDNRVALIQSRVETAVREQTAATESLTVDDVAGLMRISTSRVRHRILDGSIYAYPSNGRGTARRIPAWQFQDREPVPHLAEVLDALPDRYRASQIRAFALNAQVDEPSGDDSMALLDWLRDGGDPAVAHELAAAQGRFI